MLFQYWPTANGAGPTLKQHWVKSSCLLGELFAFGYTVPSVSGWNRLHTALCTWTRNIGIQLKRKELTKILWLIYDKNKNFGLHALQTYFRVVRVQLLAFLLVAIFTQYLTLWQYLYYSVMNHPLQCILLLFTMQQLVIQWYLLF